MVFHAQERCTLARQELTQLIQEWEPKDVASLSSGKLFLGAGIIFQESVRLYMHLQAGTVPPFTMTEGLFTQFYNRMVRREGDPAAIAFLLAWKRSPCEPKKRSLIWPLGAGSAGTVKLRK